MTSANGDCFLALTPSFPAEQGAGVEKHDFHTQLPNKLF